MKPVFQNDTTIHTGNCFEACLASLLDVPLTEIPHAPWAEDEDTDTAWYDHYNRWLSERGLQLLSFPYSETWRPSGYGMLLCRPGGIRHAVVSLNGQPIWNPMPGYGERIGEIGPLEYDVIFQVLMPHG